MKAGLGAIGVALFLALWQIASASRLVDPVLLPPLQIVFRAFIANWTHPAFVNSVYTTQIGATISRMLAGFCAASVSGITLGVLMGSSDWLSERLHLTLSLARYLPPAIIVPVVLLFFGRSGQTVLTVIIFGAFWPVLLNTIDGVRGVDSMLVDVARLHRYRAFDIALQIVFPMALPQIVIGLRLAVSACLLSAVVGEMLGGADGLGYTILIAQRTFSYQDMYGGIFLLGVLGIASNGLFRLFERRVLRWHPIVRSSEIA